MTKKYGRKLVKVVSIWGIFFVWICPKALTSVCDMVSANNGIERNLVGCEYIDIAHLYK